MIWKDIKGFEGKYSVSELGDIKRLACCDSTGRNKPEKMLTEKCRWGKYKNVELWLNGIRSVFPVHRLVYEHFVGPIPEGCLIHHKDGNKMNNHPSNLEVMTDLEHNREHYTGRISWNRGKKYGETDSWKKAHAARQITLDTRNKPRNDEIFRLLSLGVTAKEIAEKVGLCDRQIYTIIKTKGHLYAK